jgi:hypothetical protein
LIPFEKFPEIKIEGLHLFFIQSNPESFGPLQEKVSIFQLHIDTHIKKGALLKGFKGSRV